MFYRHLYYYLLKPYLPKTLRMAVRQAVASHVRRRDRHTWPIDEEAKTPPKGWPGWPNGKQFALVLTHDVEGPLGLAQCKRLAALEIELGFRSCFNFIPEGSYAVPDELRSWLIERGFEVGVHDLRHDGKLYLNRTQFNRSATRINHYIEKWNAKGFRSGFMHHNQEWLLDLNIEYDSSTFDTDPFEPQPDGVKTIFPFLCANGYSQVQAASIHRPLEGHIASQRKGYIELPYTLPQDSTLFLVLKEKTPSIWIEKTAWIARHGGLVLINVHPDYLHQASIESHYQAWLRVLLSDYKDKYWAALPREVSTYARNALHTL